LTYALFLTFFFSFFSFCGKDNIYLDAIFELRIHGHIRIDNRWVHLSDPIRKIYGQDDQSGDHVIMPPYKEFQTDQIACILTSPAVVITEGMHIGDDRKNGNGAGNSAHNTIVSNQIGVKVWRRSFAVQLPDKLLPSFKGYGSKIFYMATLSVRSKSSRSSSLIRLVKHHHQSNTVGASGGGGGGGGGDANDKGVDIHVPFTIQAYGKNEEPFGDNSQQKVKRSSSVGGGGGGGGGGPTARVRFVDLCHIELEHIRQDSSSSATSRPASSSVPSIIACKYIYNEYSLYLYAL
jgi:hypothetical protein